MRKIDRLKKDAREACRWRGHVMNGFETTRKNNGKILRAAASCYVCKKDVFIVADPLPNEIDIAGEAVALGCND